MDWWPEFILQVRQTTWYEAVAALTGIASVWFSKKENLLVFPIGMVSVLIYVYIGYTYKLYADAGVNAYYFVMSIYGWIHWTDKQAATRQIPIGRNSPSEHRTALILFVVSFLLLKNLLDFTPSDVPLWDAFTTAAAITAMWLMAKKRIEHWIFWLICDLSSIPLYAYKGLYFTSLQFVIFTVIAYMGLRSWQAKLNA